jgi:hypothetical protein
MTWLANRMGLATALLCLAPELAFAQQQQFGQPPNTYVTWGTNNRNTVVDVTYFIGAGFTANNVNLITSAATQWSQTGANIRLVEVASAGLANITFTMANLGNTGHLSNVTTGARVTVSQGGTLNGNPWAMIQSQENITINSFYPWWDGTGPQGARYDFQAELLDVMGYGIGLGFVNAGTQLTSVMQPTFTPGVPGNHSLSPADIASVQAIYGAPEPTTLALFGVGLSLVGLSRHRRGASASRTGFFPPALRRR